MLSRVVGCALAVLVVSGSCVAVAPAADRGPFWWEPPEAVAPSGTEIEAIACPSARLCVAAAGGNILTSTDPTGGPSSWRVDHVDGGTFDGCSLCGVPSRSVACPSRYLCLAVDRAGALVMSADPAAGGSSWRAVDLDLGAQVPLAVDCASRSLCVIVGGGLGGGDLDRPAGRCEHMAFGHDRRATVPVVIGGLRRAGGVSLGG